MERHVRLYQFKYWFSGHDVLKVLGKVREVERGAPGALSWKALEEFKSVGKECPEEEPLEDDCVEEAPAEVLEAGAPSSRVCTAQIGAGAFSDDESGSGMSRLFDED